MSNKKITREDLIATEGPMNNVASDDAMVYANADSTRPLDNKRKRVVVAKKQKIKKSSKKTDRRITKSLIRNVDNLPKD
jgi:hypothetical protein|tara:strand:- start:1 stop:237 length:237 start_codon:yes stop_codon:yes gene_type:complete